MAISVYFDGKLIKQLGTYVKTDLSAVKQINGVGTGIIGVLGLAEGGEENRAYRLTSYQEAVSIFKGGPLLDHIKAMFLGGAGEIVAIRIGSPTAASRQIAIKQNASETETAAKKLIFTSLEKSARSNQIYVSFDLDSGLNTASLNDDVLILNIYQRNPDFSVIRETFVFPRKFTDTTVLVERGDSLFFVEKAIINAAKATGTAWKNTLINLLKDTLKPTDKVQIFHDEGGSGNFLPVDVPLYLLLYEINKGGLFGNDKSRLVRADFSVLSSIYNSNSLAFFNDTTGNYRTFTDLVSNNIVIPSPYNINIVVDNNINGHILATRIYTLSGGSNGDDGTGYYGTPTASPITVWMSGLAVLEEEEVNFVQPAYRFKDSDSLQTRLGIFNTIASTILSHITTLSQTNRRKPRISVLGFPAPAPNESINASQYLYDKNILSISARLFGSTDRAQVVVFPFYSNVLNDSGRKELLGGEFFASYVAGLHANREPQSSITFLPIGGLGAEPLYDFTYTQKDDLISQRILFVERVKNSFGAIVYRIHHNPTSWLGAVTEGIQEMVVRRIDDFVNVYIYKNLQEQFVGRKSYGKRTESEIKSYTELLLSRLVGKQISAFKDVKVQANEDKTVYYVEFFYQPVTEIKFILVTMRMSFDLA